MTTSIELPQSHSMIIDGLDAEALDGQRFTRESPGDDTVVASYPQASTGDVDRAVKAASRAFSEGPWPDMPGVERASILYHVAQLIRRDAAQLARTEALESGKPIGQALGEIEGTAGLWEYAASVAGRAYSNRFMPRARQLVPRYRPAPAAPPR